MRERISVRFDLDEVSGADVDQDVGGVVESGGDVEGGGEGDEDSVGRRAHGEVVEGGGRDLEARGGAANVVETVLQKIDFQIGLLFHRLQLLHAHPLQTHRTTLPRTHRTNTKPSQSNFFNSIRFRSQFATLQRNPHPNKLIFHFYCLLYKPCIQFSILSNFW